MAVNIEAASGAWGASNTGAGRKVESKVGQAGRWLDKTFYSGDWDKKNAQEAQQKKIEEERRAAEKGYMEQQRSATQKYGDEANRRIFDYENYRGGLEDTMRQREGEYLSDMKGREQEFVDAQSQLRNEAESMGKDAQATYTNSIKPKMQGLMDKAYENAQSAMSLSEAGDPNNKVQTAYRDLYNKEASSLQNQAYQDYGVLSALGAQASQYGAAGAGAPMTAGQQMAMQATQQRQAGEAYAATQRRMAELRQRGMDVGREESGLQYERGQRAQEAASARAGEMFNAEGLQQARLAQLRGERGAYGENILGSKSRLGEANVGVAQSQMGRGLGYGRESLGMKQGLASEMMSREDAQRMAELGQRNYQSQFEQQLLQQQMLERQQQLAARQQILTGGMQTAGTIVGSMYGGPAGGAAGGAAGKGAGNIMTGGGAAAQPNQYQPGTSGGPQTYQMAPQSYQPGNYYNQGLYGQRAVT